MPATSIWDGTVWQPIQGLEGADGTDGQDGATGPQGDKGDQGDQGIPGPSSVSTDAGNITTLGSDSLIYTPDNYLPLSGGTMAGIIDMAGNRIVGLTWQLWDVWKLRASAAAGFLINTPDADGDLRIAKFDTDFVEFFQSDDATSALLYNRTQDFWEFGTEVRMGDNILSGVGILKGGSLGLNVVASDVAAQGIDFSDGANTLFQMFDAGIWAYRTINLTTGYLNIDRTGSGMIVAERSGGDVVSDGFHFELQLTSGTVALQTGSADGTTVPNASCLVFNQSRFWLEPTVTDVRFQAAASFATTATANMAIPDLGNGLIRIATSSRRYKTNIQPAPELKDIALNPVSFYREDDDRDLIGLIAEELADEDERLALYDDDGEVQNFADRGVLAVLAAKVNDLTARVSVLET